MRWPTRSHAAPPGEVDGEVTRVRGLLDVTRFCIPTHVVAFGHEFLRDVGRRGFEGLVLWAGRIRPSNPEVVDVIQAIVPKQRGTRGANGVGLVVEGDELFRLNVLCHQRKLKLVGQVHSHPSGAYHSDIDDAYAIITMPGGLSLVVPDFAANPFEPHDVAVYRLSAIGEWEELSVITADALVRIEDAAGNDNADVSDNKQRNVARSSSEGD
jgi:hypothetical protein